MAKQKPEAECLGCGKSLEDGLPPEDVPLLALGTRGDIGIDPRFVSYHSDCMGGLASLTPSIVYATAFKWNANILPLWEGGTLGTRLPDDQLDELFVYGLAYWCMGQPDVIDECFRASERFWVRHDRGLPRWETVEGEGSKTYGQRVVEQCIKPVKVYYGDRLRDFDH